VIQTQTVEGCTLEGGPDSFLAVKPAAVELIREVGLGDEVIGSNDELRTTYILRRGKLEPLPDGMMMMIPTKIMPVVKSNLLGWGTKIKMGLEYFRRPSKHEDRSVRDFLVDHYGQESVDYLAEPLLAGVYGGDPGELSVNSVLTRFVELESKYGSLTRAVLSQPRPKGSGPLFRTLKRGLSDLIDALTPSADVVHGTAEMIERTEEGYRVRVNGDWMEASAIVLAIRAYQAAELLKPFDPVVADLLHQVPYTSSLTFSIGYRKSDVERLPAGHGFLVPKRERKHVKACTFVARKFNYRVPDHLVVLRCFMSGHALDESDASLLQIAREELRAIIGLNAEPLFHTIHRWPGAMAQYTVGHGKRIDEVRARVSRLSGMHVIGNAFDGIGIPDCIRLGKQAAQQLSNAQAKPPAAPVKIEFLSK